MRFAANSAIGPRINQGPPKFNASTVPGLSGLVGGRPDSAFADKRPYANTPVL
jgi:hypothetical protein